MTELQRNLFRQSEIRSALMAEDIKAEDEQKLTKEYAGLQSEQRKLMIVADKPSSIKDTSEEVTETVDTATEKRLELRSRCSVGNIMDSLIGKSELSGANKELQQELGLAHNVVPLELLAVEKRAVTPSPTNVGRPQQTIEPAVFPDSLASMLRIPMPTVPAGTPLYPDVGTSAAVGGPHKDSTAVAETTGSFNTVLVEPARFQASYFYRRTDAAKFAGMDAALRENLNMALSDKLDSYIIGQLIGDTTIDKATAPTKALTYPQTLTEFAYGRVDGTWVSGPGDVFHVVNSVAYSTMAALYQNTARGSALEMIMEKTAGLRVSAHVAAASSNVSTGIARLGSRRDAVAPIWQGVLLLDDQITKASTGEIVITAVMMANFQLLRKGGFYLTQSYA